MRAVPIRSRRRRAAPLRAWGRTGLAGGAIALAIVAMVAFGQAVARPRAAVQSASYPPPVTSDTPMEPAPLAPPEVTQREALAQRPVRFTARPIEPSYTVAAGDTLSSIAQRYNTNVDALRGINNLSDARLSIGQRLIIP